MTLTEKHQQYAKDVVSEKIVACKYIKQACKRYLSLFNKYEYREDKVENVISFISKLKHSTGKHNGKKFILEPWQSWIVSSIFGFYKTDGTRLVNNAYIEVARKNGKTALLSAMSLYCLVADGESGAEVDYLANNAKQAGIAFKMASDFLSSIDPRGKYFGRYRSTIKFPKTKSFIQVLSSEASGLDGFNSSCFVLDECHEQKDSRLYDVMVSSQGMRDNPLALISTTAGFNQYGFCYPFRQTCLEIVAQVKEDDSTFAAIFTLDDEDNWEDENNWIKANPNMNITVKADYIRNQIQKAKLNPSLVIGTKTKNLNMWCSSSDIWIDNDLLLDSTKEFELKDFEYETVCWCGVDLSAVSDLTALSVLIPYENMFYFKSFYYLPESCLEGNPNSRQYLDWKNQGYLNITPGNVVDYDYLTKDILKITDHLLIDKIAYDQYNATKWAIDATSEGIPLEPYAQALWNFNKPTKEFERLIKMGRVIIDNNPITRWCFANVVLKEDHNENCKPVKGETKHQKIDGVISMLQALGVYLQQPQFSTDISSLTY